MNELFEAILSSARYDDMLETNLVEFDGNFYALTDEEIKKMEEFVNQ